jgi:hypothetical protein
MGYLERNRPLVDVKGLRGVTGGTLPAAMWNEYMRRALAGTAATAFADAPGRNMAAGDGLRASPRARGISVAGDVRDGRGAPRRRWSPSLNRPRRSPDSGT